MNIYETSATVEDQGRIQVVGVPFEPGTRVDITITMALNGAHSPGTNEQNPNERLLAALNKARNTETVGRLCRSELYDRDILH